MLLTLMMNLNMFGQGAEVEAPVGDTHDAPPPWIRTKEQIEYLRKQKTVPPKVVEELEEIIAPYVYTYQPGKPPYIDYEGIAEQAALMARVMALYEEAMQAYMLSLLADDEAFLEALAASREIL